MTTSGAPVPSHPLADWNMPPKSAMSSRGRMSFRRELADSYPVCYGTALPRSGPRSGIPCPGCHQNDCPQSACARCCIRER